MSQRELQEEFELQSDVLNQQQRPESPRVLPSAREGEPARQSDEVLWTQPQASKSQSLTFTRILAIILSMQIGSGIFASPAYVYTMVGSPIKALLAWAFAGLLIWQGAITLAEFATRLPSSGGIATYLEHCYGRYWDYLFSSVWILIEKPGGSAMISLVLADYFSQAVWPNERSRLTEVLIAMLVLNGTTAFNVRGNTVGAGAAVYFMVAKISSAVAIIVLGGAFVVISWSAKANDQIADNIQIGNASETSKTQITHFVEATFGAAFAYGGWDNLGFLAGEAKPGVNFANIIHTSMSLVIALFIAINLSLYGVLVPSQMQETNAVAVAFGQTLFGIWGGIAFAFVVVMSCLGALNASIFSAARLTRETYAKGFVTPLFVEISERLSPLITTNFNNHGMRESSPQISLATAMWFNVAIANIYVLLGTFRGLIIFKGVVQYLFYCVAISGIFRLRADSPKTTIGRRLLASISPSMFCLGSAFIVSWKVYSAPMLLMGIVIIFTLISCCYYFTIRSPTIRYQSLSGGS